MKLNDDQIRELASTSEYSVWTEEGYAVPLDNIAKLIHAIQSEEKLPEHIGTLTVWRFRGIDGMVNHDFDYFGDLPDGGYSVFVVPSAGTATAPTESK